MNLSRAEAPSQSPQNFHGPLHLCRMTSVAVLRHPKSQKLSLERLVLLAFISTDPILLVIVVLMLELARQLP